MRDYRSAEWDLKSAARAFAGSVLSVLLLAYFFYRSLFAVIPLSFVGYLYFRTRSAEKIRKDKRELESQFMEAIRAVQTALKAGYSVENAFIQSGKDMEREFGRDSAIFREMEMIRRGLVINITLEEMLGDLGRRSGSEAVEDFAGVFAIAKRFGGNMSEVISSSVETISVQIENSEEIRTALAGRKAEFGIMKVMPFGILFYVGITSPGYFDSLYGNLTGTMLMTGLLLVYLAGFYLGDRILRKLEEG